MRAIRSAVLLVVLVCFANCALAATVQVVRLQGNVTAQVGTGPAQTLRAGDTVREGVTIATGQGSNAVLRFDDGQVVALQSLSRFTIDSYRYDAKTPGAGQVVLSLLTGGLRVVTGLVANTKRSAFTLNTPVATIGIRGTDFLGVLSQGLYNKINAGSIGVTSSEGTGVFAAGQYSFTASPAVLPAGIAASALPAGIFVELEAIVITGAATSPASAGGTASSGGASTGAAATGGAATTAAGAASFIGLGVAGLAAGLSSGDTNPVHHAATHH